MNVKRDPSQLLQFGFVGLLIISLVQVGYWIYDHVDHAETVRDELNGLYANEATAINALLSGAGVERLIALLPQIEIDTTNDSARVRPEALAEIDRTADGR